MAQNIDLEDVSREVRAVFAIADAQELSTAAISNLFCNAERGDARCDRHHKHHGRHAHLTGFHFDRDKGWWSFARIVTWK